MSDLVSVAGQHPLAGMGLAPESRTRSTRLYC
jgi:hypothetical protein